MINISTHINFDANNFGKNAHAAIIKVARAKVAAVSPADAEAVGITIADDKLHFSGAPDLLERVLAIIRNHQ